MQYSSASTTGRVTFQSTPNSGVNSTRSSNEGPASPNLELSKKDVFENNLTQLFTKGFIAVLTSKDAVLKEVRDCLFQRNEQRCKDGIPTSTHTGDIYLLVRVAFASTNDWPF